MRRRRQRQRLLTSVVRSPLYTHATPANAKTEPSATGAGDRNYPVKVTVAQKVNNFFGGIFGIGADCAWRSRSGLPSAAPIWEAPRTISSTTPDGHQHLIAADLSELLGQHHGGGRHDNRRRVPATGGQPIRTSNSVNHKTGANRVGNATTRTTRPRLHSTRSTSPGRLRTAAVSTPLLVNVGQFCH